MPTWCAWNVRSSASLARACPNGAELVFCPESANEAIIAEVVSRFFFGVPDARYGEELCAWIITKPGQACTEDEIRAFCRDQIAHYKQPRWIRFVDELPVTVTGKPQKFLMRDAMMRELGLSVQASA